MDRRHLDADQRRKLAQHLRGEGHSLRAIGEALGTSKDTVARDLAEPDVPPVSGETGGTSTEPEPIQGTDGKSYPAKRTTRTPDEEAALYELHHVVDINRFLAARN